MIERIYILESVDPVIFYGVNNVNMQLIKTLFPKLRIVARGNVMKVIGDEDESELFLKKIREVEKYCEEFNSLSEDVILDIIKGKAPVITKQENLIIHGMNGKPIVARTENQQRLVKAFEENDLVFATGPAGTGKTFVAIALAVKALKNGAADFLLKPWDNQTLIDKVTEAYHSRKAPERTAKVDRAEGFEMLVGRSPAMLQLMKVVSKVARTDANILITGENGTGKEMLAREIHNRSARSGELMVSVDMGAVPETLFESELFGHVKGAFTDARADRAGKFEVADHGTLFLDEIGNLPPHLQSKLLTAIQGGRIFRVGSNTPVAVDIRLICATNRDLFGMVARGGEFREDLLYRINTIHIDLPPLRQRREDILPLAEMFLKRYATKYNKPIEGFDQAAVREMDEYPWAGNIRELQHTVEKAVIMSDGRRITPATLLLRPAPAAVQAPAFSTLEEMERGMIGQAMARYAGNLTEVARQLGITRQTLYNKIKRYGL